ncbi:hypothetical protein AAFF_G00087340 [Aldrovandia affinis]|uniref:Uncharacterized protein n=1 Tax=Aldrovandia affinis TaxID=143900 RepID=A0AAD7RWR8_9TELE|nr:hypothetical protein AAFF_G00087340 [Aldrovandia affinis]
MANSSFARSQWEPHCIASLGRDSYRSPVAPQLRRTLKTHVRRFEGVMLRKLRRKYTNHYSLHSSDAASQLILRLAVYRCSLPWLLHTNFFPDRPLNLQGAMEVLCATLLLLLLGRVQGTTYFLYRQKNENVTMSCQHKTWQIDTNYDNNVDCVVTINMDKKEPLDRKATPPSRNFTALFVVVPLLITSTFVMAIYMKKRSIISKGPAYSGAGGESDLYSVVKMAAVLRAAPDTVKREEGQNMLSDKLCTIVRFKLVRATQTSPAQD